MAAPETKWDSMQIGDGFRVEFAEGTYVQEMEWFTGSYEERAVTPVSASIQQQERRYRPTKKTSARSFAGIRIQLEKQLIISSLKQRFTTQRFRKSPSRIQKAIFLRQRL